VLRLFFCFLFFVLCSLFFVLCLGVWNILFIGFLEVAWAFSVYCSLFFVLCFLLSVWR